MTTFAILPAAGLSRRMGVPKLALPLGDQTVLERVIQTVTAASIEHILVVVGPSTVFLRDIAEKAGAQVLVLTSETPDMRATLEAGLSWIEGSYQPLEDDPILVLPADHPVLEPAVIRTLVESLAGMSESAGAVPVYQGKRGHPLLLRWKDLTRLSQLPPDVGLNALVRQIAGGMVEVNWPNNEVLRDMDTPAEYDKMRSDHG